MKQLPNPGTADWSGLRVAVAGIGIAGFACADALLQRGADVVIVDESHGPEQRNKAQILEVLDAVRRLHGCSVVVATHDPAVVRHVDRVLRLERGLLGPGDR